MNSHASYSERTQGGFVIALYLAASLLLLYIVFRVVLDQQVRLAPPVDPTTQTDAPTP